MSYFSSFISKLSANNRASSVLPVPVGPKNKKLAMGFFSLAMPAKLMYTRSSTPSTAESCPYNFCLILDSRSTILAERSFCSLSVGTPVTRVNCSSIRALVINTVPRSFTRSRAQAASIRSIDLSGFFRSCMYRLPNSTAAVIASVSISTL